jgi:glycerol dehydrogenase-like iron-containing ADH family enzyme
MARFFSAIDVPVTLAGLGYALDDSQLMAVATHVCGPASTAHHLKTPISPGIVKAAMITADRLGHYVSSL